MSKLKLLSKMDKEILEFETSVWNVNIKLDKKIKE